MELNDMQQDVAQIFSDFQVTGTNAWTYKTAVFDMIYQAGTLVKRVEQIENDRSSGGMSEKEINSLLADELVEILAEVLFIAHDREIDLPKEWKNMLSRDKRKIRAATPVKPIKVETEKEELGILGEEIPETKTAESKEQEVAEPNGAPAETAEGEVEYEEIEVYVDENGNEIPADQITEE